MPDSRSLFSHFSKVESVSSTQLLTEPTQIPLGRKCHHRFDPMTQPTDYAARAAKCSDLAQKAKDERDRKRWLDMEQFWLRHAENTAAAGSTASKPSHVIEV